MNVIPVGKYEAWVDDVDYLWAKSQHWTSCNRGDKVRAMIGGAKGTFPFKQMSRFIAERMYGPLPRVVMVDHRNGVPLDNRRGNLRLASRSINGRNRAVSRIKKNNLPLGVYFSVNKKRFVARMKGIGKNLHLGTYDTVLQASNVYRSMSDAKMAADELKVLEQVHIYQGTLSCKIKL